MDNYVQSGKTLTLVAPYDVASGAGFLVGAIFAIAVRAALEAAPVEGTREGVYTLPKTSAQAWTQGQKVYWDNTNKRCDSDSTVGMLIGVATDAAADPSSTGTVLLNAVAPPMTEGAQAHIADIATADGSDAATTQALANATKAKFNTLLAELRLAGVLKSS
jgi:predicted RecA/RadA family phage recombinase